MFYIEVIIMGEGFVSVASYLLILGFTGWGR